jgi:peptidoglycan/xylan/chitin deacetylase (PgdA/CDA1 family)
MAGKSTRVVKLLGALIDSPILELWRAMGKLFGQPFSGIAVAIYYHRVVPEDARRFARQMDHLIRWSEPSGADRCVAPPPGSRSVIVTFDDGWQSFHTTALPEIARRQIPVTLFSIAGRFGGRLEDGVGERLLTAEELLSLPRELVTIGSHTCTHPDLPTLADPDMRRELRDSRKILQDLTKTGVDHFCFPYGSFSPRALALCAEEGYKKAFTGVPKLAMPSRDGFAVGRIAVEPSDWPLEFHLKISGAYCWVPLAIALKRTLRGRLKNAAPAD